MITQLNTAQPGKSSGNNTGLIALGVLALAGLAYWQFVYKPEQEKLKEKNG